VTPTVVIGVGNPFRGDDGAGPAVAELVADRLGATHRDDVEVRVLDGEPARLVEAWAGARLAVVVDALRSGAAAGTVRRIEIGPGSRHRLRQRGTLASSHGAGLQAALELGRALERLPDRLVVLGVEGDDFREGPGLSTAVAACLEPTAARVLSEVSP
jgi:hydrogenase maturation protease